MTLRIIKGGKPVDLSSEVRLMFGKLAAQAAYHEKQEEFDHIQEIYQENVVESSEHLLALELFSHFDSLLELAPAPLSFISKFITQLEEEEQDGEITDAG